MNNAPFFEPLQNYLSRVPAIGSTVVVGHFDDGNW